MTNRSELCTAFLAKTDWADAERRPLAGDASNRRYERLHDKARARTAVLMDAPPEKGEDTRPFLHIAQHLAEAGLSAPRIFAQDPANGFMVLEDLGDDLFARVALRCPDLEPPLYSAATDVLLALHEAPIPEGISPYTPQIMADMAGLAYDWYLSAISGENPEAKACFTAQFLPLLHSTETEPPVLILRDYHAENLLWLPERDGIAKVGLLDFQDAMAGHPAYDLVSLLQDARRDVAPDSEQQMIARYVRQSAIPHDRFDAAYHILGTQRNLRILGVFARLCLRDGKPEYIDLIPRVWAHIRADLAHPALASVASHLHNTLPAPTPKILQELKAKCATHP